MTAKEILSKTDHTLLRPDATWQQIQTVLDEGMAFGTASVCLPPCFVKEAVSYVTGALPVCTVIGFPNGYATTASKCFEAEDAVKNGAAEIDMVIQIGLLKEGKDEALFQQINAVRQSCGTSLLKVIVETCMLTEEEKVRVCRVVDASDAEYIKTSTGFAGSGAALEDIILWKSMICHGTKIKAAGGIRTLADAGAFLAAGASRIGASALVSEARATEMKNPSAAR